MCRMNVLIGVTGSVAAIKLFPLVKRLVEVSVGVHVKIVVTKHGLQFINEVDMAWLTTSVDGVHADEEEWTQWSMKGDPILHIDLRRWADVLVIAPLSANTLAKIASGMCDNLLTSVIRAWDREKRMIVCPAMNTLMWENPFTAKHLDVLRDVYNAEVVMPKDGYALACGDIGTGAMAGVEDIVSRILR